MKKNTFMKIAWPWLFISGVVIVLDQLSKWLVIHAMPDESVVSLLPFLNMIVSFNTGASFGFLDHSSGWHVYMLSLISAFISVILIRWLMRIPRHDWWVALPVSLVLGGAIGNLIDRLHYGFVIDFIDFHVKSWHYATFNIADSAVCIGAVWLVIRLSYESFTRES